MRQSGSEKPRHGRISKQGPGEVRHVLVEAAWHAMRTPGPLHVFAERIAAKRGVNVAVVAVARKLVVIAWHMLTKQEDYAFTRPSLVREKIRRLELLTGTGRKRGEKGLTPIYASRAQRNLELDLARQAERGLRPPRPRLAASDEKGCGRRTGARIVKSAEATSSAAGHSPTSCA